MYKRKSSFSIRTPKSRSSQHNNRTDKPKYLIAGSQDNFYKKYSNYENDKQYSEYAQELYKAKVGQKMQEKQKPKIVEEVVISLKPHHNENDLLNLFDTLREKFGGGFKILEMSIHRDEGHFIDKNGLTYYPNTDIFFNEADNNWYLDKNFTKSTKELELNKILNIHSHIKFTHISDDTGRKLRMQKKDYIKMHQIVANTLKMNYAPSKNSKIRRSVGEIKAYHQANRLKNLSILENLLNEKEKISKKDLAKLKKEYREKLIATEKASKEDYNKLHQLFKNAEEQRVQGLLDIQNIKIEFSKTIDKLNKLGEENNNIYNLVPYLENEIKILEKENQKLKDDNLWLEDKLNKAMYILNKEFGLELKYLEEAYYQANNKKYSNGMKL